MNKPDNQESYILVNHNQQVKVYENIAQKIGIKIHFGDSIVNKPTKFLNKHNINDKHSRIDISLIDEDHLLLTEGYMVYQGSVHLKDIRGISKVVVDVLDSLQILKENGYIEKSYYDKLISRAKGNDHQIELSEQNRMCAFRETIDWIENIVTKNKIDKIPEDNKYDLRILTILMTCKKKLKNIMMVLLSMIYGAFQSVINLNYHGTINYQFRKSTKTYHGRNNLKQLKKWILHSRFKNLV